MADVYIVMDGSRVVGVSARLQGAELMRNDEALRLAETRFWTGDRGSDPNDGSEFYDRMRIENHELRDED